MVEFKFPISIDKTFLHSIFAFDLEIFNVQSSEYFESYAGGAYHLNIFFEFFNGDLNERELFVGRLKIQMFQEKNGDPLLRMIDFIINNYGGQPKYGTKKHSKRVLLSWKYQMVGHNASVFDNCNVLNSLPSSFK